LGHEFLRHIERCHVLVFVVDIAGTEGRDPMQDLRNLRREINLYDPKLSLRDWFVIANKMDLAGAEKNLKALQEKFPKFQIFPISAVSGEGIEALKQELAMRIILQ
jgi:GTP-binding protein